MPGARELIELIVVGLAAGAFGGLMGIGGSVVMIPALVILHGASQQHLYQASAMIVNFFVVAPAVVRHRMATAELRAVTRWMAPSAVAGAILGVVVSDLPVFQGRGQGYLQIVFGVFLLYVLAYNLYRLGQGKRLAKMSEQEAAGLSKWRVVWLVGLPAGLLGGLLGVGGGLVAVPAQQVALRVPLTSAIANSASTILWSSVVGAVVKNYSLSQHGFGVGRSVMLALCLAPAAMVGSWWSSARVHRWPVGIIRIAFSVLLGYGSFKMLTAGWWMVMR
jgi:uncharacterized membrane protein YfcA